MNFQKPENVSIITKLLEFVLEQLGKRSIKKLDKLSKNSFKDNEKLLLKIIKNNKNSEFGKKYNFQNINSIKEFKKNVPLSAYEDYEPYIKRMINNKETNLLCSLPIVQYAETSGTVGQKKMLPVSKQALSLYTQNTITKVAALSKQYYMEKGIKIPRGKGLNLLESQVDLTNDGKPHGVISGAAASKYKRIFKYYLTSPIPVLFPKGKMNMRYMKVRFALEDKWCHFIFAVFMFSIVDLINFIKENWEIIVKDIENGTIDESMCDAENQKRLAPYLKKNPKRAHELREIFKCGFEKPFIKKVWPNMSWIYAIGTGSFQSYTDIIRKYIGDIPIDYSIYGASEGLFGVCRKFESPDLMLLLNSCFYEFIEDDGTENSNNKTLTVNQLEKGKNYEIIITNLSGLYRYKMQDVISVVGFYNSCPLIRFAYRKNLTINIASERTTIEHLDTTINKFEKQFDCKVTEYCVYLDYSTKLARYIVLIETEEPFTINKDINYSKFFEDTLTEINPEYKADKSSIGKLQIKFQQPQTHALWRELKSVKYNMSTNQIKPLKLIRTEEEKKFFFSLVEE